MEESVFINQLSFEERKSKCDTLKKKYPDRIPIIILKNKNSKIKGDECIK